MSNNDNKSCASTSINWYPGHMAKTKRQIIEDLKLIDIVVEIVDARMPISSQNPDLKEYIKNKKRIIVLNKSDLADEAETQKWIRYFKSKNINAIATDSSTGRGINEVLSLIKKVSKENEEINKNKGRIGKSTRVIVIGIPNIGKSSFINKISKKASAQVGNKPGVTKQKQWIRISEGIELMDTPGVLWPKFKTEEVALNLAYTGTIKDEILEKVEIAFNLLKYLIAEYQNRVLEKYNLNIEEIQKILNKKEEENEKIYEIMQIIAKKRGAILSGGRIDDEKIASIILDEFRKRKIWENNT